MLTADLSLAFRAGTLSSQKLPRVNPAAMAVVPVEIDRVFADWGDLKRASRLLVHGQSSRFGLRRLTNLASAGVAFFVARSARAGVAQPGKRIVAPVTVFPLDIHARTGGFFHLNRPRIGRRNGQNTGLLGLNAPHFLGWTALNGFVRHTKSMTLGARK